MVQLHRVGMFPPDKKLYPVYDDWLETSLRAEPVEYFRELLKKNLPIDDLLDSNWTIANARCVNFTDCPNPSRTAFTRLT